MDLNDVLNNEFFQSLIEDQKKTTDNALKRKGFDFDQSNFHILNVNEKKTSRTFRLTYDLITTINDIRIIYALINRRPAVTYLNKHDISELEYIKFHYEVYMHKIHTICELMKLIANDFLNIDLHPYDCTWTNLIKHKEFNSSSCKKIIQKYFDDFEYLIKSRHLNTHRGIYNDEEMNEINLTYNTYKYFNKLNLPVDEEYRKTFPYLYVQIKLKQFKKDKLKEILASEQLILNHIKSFFNTLIWTE